MVVVIVALTLVATTLLPGRGPGGVRSIEATTPTYTFGQAVLINEFLNMASYGPVKSNVSICSTATVQCLKISFSIILAPKDCRVVGRRRKIRAGGYTAISLGTVSYRNQVDQDILKAELFFSPARPNSVYGYTIQDGVAFMALENANLVKGLLSAKNPRSLQAAFDERRDQFLFDTSISPMMLCLL